MDWRRHIGRRIPGPAVVVLGWESGDEERGDFVDGEGSVVYGVMTGYDVGRTGASPPPIGAVFVPCEGPEEARALAPEMDGTVVFGWLIEDQMTSNRPDPG